MLRLICSEKKCLLDGRLPIVESASFTCIFGKDCSGGHFQSIELNDIHGTQPSIHTRDRRCTIVLPGIPMLVLTKCQCPIPDRRFRKRQIHKDYCCPLDSAPRSTSTNIRCAPYRQICRKFSRLWQAYLLGVSGSRYAQ
jgi:hypothetical protein